jgi:tetratricopeptide (TPR) repeat protein
MQEDNYRCKVEAFLRFKNVLTVFCGKYPLADLLDRYGQAVKAYGADLLARCRSDATLADRRAQQEKDMCSPFVVQPKVSFAVDLFADLVQSQEWGLLSEQARRHLDNPDETTKTQARRVLALALARSAKVSDKNEAIREYETLIRDNLANVQDRGILATLLLDLDRPDEAKAAVLQAIVASPREALVYLGDIGQRIVGQTGDREFRKKLEAAIAQRSSHD